MISNPLNFAKPNSNVLLMTVLTIISKEFSQITSFEIFNRILDEIVLYKLSDELMLSISKTPDDAVIINRGYLLF